MLVVWQADTVTATVVRDVRAEPQPRAYNEADVGSSGACNEADAGSIGACKGGDCGPDGDRLERHDLHAPSLPVTL